MEQGEDKITELEDEMVIKGKTKELLSLKKLKICEEKMQNSSTPSKEQT
jgi:hypothetical protein